MDKGSQLAIGVSIVIFAIVAAFFAPMLLNVTGTSVLSVDQVELTSSSEFFSGMTWILNAKQSSLSQTAIFNSAPIISKDGEESVENLELIITYPKQECVYPFTVRNEDAYPKLLKKNMVAWGCAFVPSTSKCVEKAMAQDDFYSGGIYARSDTCSKVIGLACQTTYNTEEHKIGVPQDSYIDYEINVQIKVGDESRVSGSITPDQKQIFLPSGNAYFTTGDYAFIKLDDFYSTSKNCPYNIRMPYYAVYDSGWNLFESTIYDTEYKPFVYNAPIGTSVGRDDTQQWVNSMNYAVDRILSNSFREGVVSSNTDGALFKYDVTEDPVKKPNFYIAIKSDKLSIKTSVPKPVIKNADNSECFYTGGIDVYDKSEGTIVLRVKNEGEAGVISFGGTCDSSKFKIIDRELSFNEGQTRDITLYYTASTAKKEERVECTVKAYTVGGSDEANVELCVKGYISCESGKLGCGYDAERDLDYTKKCNSEGTGYALQEYCGGEEVCKAGECVAAGSNGGGEEDEFSFWGLIIASVVGFVVFLSILGGTANLRKADKRLNIAMWVLSALGGVVVLLLSYKLIQWIIQFFTSLKFW